MISNLRILWKSSENHGKILLSNQRLALYLACIKRSVNIISFTFYLPTLNLHRSVCVSTIHSNLTYLINFPGERVLHVTMKANPKVQWRLQENGDASNMEHLLRKAAGSEKSHPKKAVMWALANKNIEAKVHSGVHISPQPDLTTGHRTTKFNICLARFWSYFGLFPFSSL